MLGARIALLRRESGWSQKELAGHLEISPSAVGMYEQGRREPDCAGLLKLAEIFGVSVDLLLGGGAAAPEDARAVRPLWDAARALLDGTLVLRAADGTERPFGEAELAALLAALLGQTD